jgi:hypothetical protein
MQVVELKPAGTDARDLDGIDLATDGADRFLIVNAVAAAVEARIF